MPNCESQKGGGTHITDTSEAKHFVLLEEKGLDDHSTAYKTDLSSAFRMVIVWFSSEFPHIIAWLGGGWPPGIAKSVRRIFAATGAVAETAVEEAQKMEMKMKELEKSSVEDGD